MEREFSRFRINANIGYLQNSKAAERNIDYRTRFLSALGVHYPFSDKWQTSVEGYTFLTKNKNQTPAELITSLQYRQSKSLTISSGFGFSGFDSITGNDWRFLVTLKWQPAIANRVQIQSNHSTPLSQHQEKVLERVREINHEIHFDHDSTQLNAEAELAIAEIAKLIVAAGLEGNQLVIRGHANRIGEEDYNRNLSFKRAEVVRQALIANGLSAELTTAIGHGQEYPYLHDNKRIALDRSRRVDFIIR